MLDFPSVTGSLAIFKVVTSTTTTFCGGFHKCTFCTFVKRKFKTLIDMNEMLAMKPSELETFLSVESYDKKTAENCRRF